MDIKGLSAIQKYQAARPATEPANPAEAAKTIINDFATTLAVGE